MTKRLAQHGNSAALVIDKPILELLKIDMGTPLELSTDGSRLVITPVRDPAREKKLRAALAKVNERRGGTFRLKGELGAAMFDMAAGRLSKPELARLLRRLSP